MTESANQPLLFLCYAREDKQKVDPIYLDLREAGLRPWMDKPPKPHHLAGIAPGAEWETVIRQRIAEADFFIAFLSNASISKRGFVQKEFRLALRAANEVPAGENYFLPVLLEPCSPPDLGVDAVRLHDRQWYPLHEYGLDGLVSHIQSAWHRTAQEIAEPGRTFLRVDQSFRPHLFYGGQNHHSLGLQLSFLVTNESKATMSLIPPEVEIEESDLEVEFRYWRVDTGSGRQTLALGKGRTAWVKAEFDVKAHGNLEVGDRVNGQVRIRLAQPSAPDVTRRFSAAYEPDSWDA